MTDPWLRSTGSINPFADSLCRVSASARGVEEKRKTNFDRVAKSPEKLAKFLDEHKIRPCGREVMCGRECPCIKKCAKGNIPTDYEIWLAWLKQEAE